MRLSLGYQAIAALILGIFAGLFFGPFCDVLRPIADVYIMLLQMVALPYILFSLMHGLGSLTPAIGKKLLKKGWGFLVLLWGLIFGAVYLLNLLLPRRFLTFAVNITPDAEEAVEKNFLNYLVPENPIYDLANNVVPAIAIFGLIIGCALMHLEKKEPLLSILERGNQLMEKILYWLAILSPIGIFTHIAVAMGTVYFEDLYRLQFYVFSFIFIALFFTFWVLPALLSSLTPLSFKESLKAIQFVSILPFATALPTIALPFITLYMKKLGQKQAKEDPNFQATSQTVMPLCYSFGQIGNCLILLFILFMSYFYRHPLILSQKILMSLLTIPLSFGSSATSVNAVSFLTEQLSFPASANEFFSETMSITLNFQVLLSAASILTLIILILYSYFNLLKVQWPKLATHLGSAALVLLLLVGGAKWLFPIKEANLSHKYGDLAIEDSIQFPVDAKILEPNDPGTVRHYTSDSPNEPFSAILKSGVLKVGFDATQIPYCYFNHNDDLAGFDIAYAYELARDLDCKLEFVPLHLETMGAELEAGKYDIGMSSLIMDEERLKTMDFSSPYAEDANVLIVPAHSRRQFINAQAIFGTPGLKIGAIGGYKSVVKRHFPLATLVPDGDIDAELLQGKVDAWMWGQTSSIVWCGSHPHLVVADYRGLIGKRYFAYPIRSNSLDFNLFLNNWLILKEQSGFKEKMKRYWIEGESIKERQARWSILQNILNWGKGSGKLSGSAQP